MAYIVRYIDQRSSDLAKFPIMALGGIMSAAWNVVRRLGKDEEGASLVEYTVLLGILMVAVIATIGLVGTWINGKWTALQGQLS